jgi:hypothetical protein
MVNLYAKMEPVNPEVFSDLLNSLEKLLSATTQLSRKYPEIRPLETMVAFIRKKFSNQKSLMEQYGDAFLKQIKIPSQFNDIQDVIQLLKDQTDKLNDELSGQAPESNDMTSSAKKLCAQLLLINLLISWIENMFSGFANMFPGSITGQLGAGVAAGVEGEVSGSITVAKLGTIIFGSFAIILKGTQDLNSMLIADLQLLD